MGHASIHQRLDSAAILHSYLEEDRKERLKYRKEFGDWIQEKQERNRRSVVVENIELVEQNYLRKKTNEGFSFYIHSKSGTRTAHQIILRLCGRPALPFRLLNPVLVR